MRVRLEVVTSSDPTSGEVSGSRRRARAEAARSASVWVRLSPDEVAMVGAAAAQAGMSVGAWVGETAVGRARTHVARVDPDGTCGVGLSSRRELVAALVALRAEVAALRRGPVVELGPAAPPGERDPDTADRCAADCDGMVGVLRRIDTATAAVVEAVSSTDRSSSRAGQERPAGS